jgi:hypothetical protein
MQEIFSRHFDTIKRSAEFIMLPLNWLAVEITILQQLLLVQSCL